MAEGDEKQEAVSDATEVVTEALDKVETTLEQASDAVAETARETPDAALTEIRSMLLGLQSSVNDLSGRLQNVVETQAKTVASATNDVTGDIEATTSDAAQAVEEVANDIKDTSKKKQHHLGKKRR